MPGVHNKPPRQRGSLSGPLPESVLINGEYVAFNVGQFLGKGSFANVYKFVSPQLTAAGKVISKHMLKEKHKFEMIRNEIGIHNKLHHEHIVELYASWNDDSNIYMLLELCTSRSLFELHLARHAISEAETRYFMRQTISAIEYLHDKLIVHRDIKLGNLLINDQMRVKLADFGMAVQLRGPHNVLQQVCGTPNYIAPEILLQSGYSFPVDVWSLGVCCYTLMVGVPPFETKSVKATYMQIKSGHYTVPANVSSSARFVISELLRANPSSRPMAKCIEKYPWFNEGFTPRELPSTCCVVSPCINQNSDYGPVVKMEGGDVESRFETCANQNDSLATFSSTLIASQLSAEELNELNEMQMLDRVIQLLEPWILGYTNQKTQKNLTVEDEFPAGTPMFWVSRWIRDSRYGIGYELCDGTIGVLFNDLTRIILHNDGTRVQYTNMNMDECFFDFNDEGRSLDEKKKLELLKSYKTFLSFGNLLLTGQQIIENRKKVKSEHQPINGSELARWPGMKRWYLTEKEACMLISDGTFQVNNLNTHHKVVVSPTLSTITFIEPSGKWSTYQVKTLLSSANQQNIRKMLQSVGDVARLMRKNGSIPDQNGGTTITHL